MNDFCKKAIVQIDINYREELKKRVKTVTLSLKVKWIGNHISRCKKTLKFKDVRLMQP